MQPIDVRQDSDLRSAWVTIHAWMAFQRHHVEVLPVRAGHDPGLLPPAVAACRSLAAVAAFTGGILVEQGWLRLLGAPGPATATCLQDWNDGTIDTYGLAGRAAVVAHDVLGGFYALDLDAFRGPPGRMYRLQPDSLRWTDLGCGYTRFLLWAVSGDLGRYWPGAGRPAWVSQLEVPGPDEALLLDPPLWAEQISGSRRRQTVPVEQLWRVEYAWAVALATGWW